MKITKKLLTKIILEELALVNEGGDLQNTAKGAAMELLDTAKTMEQAPSHDPASNYAQFVAKQANLIMDMLVQMEDEETAGGAGLAELQSDPAYDPDPSQPGSSAGEYSGLDEIGYELGLITGKMAGVPDLEKWTKALDAILVKIQAERSRSHE